MSRAIAITRRIISQFAHDPRTLALLFVAPLLVLWLLSVLLSADTLGPRVAVVDIPDALESALEKQDARIEEASADEAGDLLENDEVSAVLACSDGVLEVQLEGADSTKSAAVIAVVTSAISELSEDASARMEEDANELRINFEESQREIEKAIDEIDSELPPAVRASLPSSMGDLLDGDGVTMDIDELSLDPAAYMPVQEVKTSYLHGNENWHMFDFYGPVFIGLFLFVFTFITSSMSLVAEREAGTMDRFLLTPVRSVEVVGGYTLGFGLLAIVQSAVILWVALSFIGFPNEGSSALVVLIGLSLALASVTLGLLVSGLASTGFQVIQLMLVFVVPQILLCGLFDLSAAPEWLQAISGCLPLTYGVEALRDVMLRGATFSEVLPCLLVVWGFIAAFFVLASLKMRKKTARGTAARGRSAHVGLDAEWRIAS